MTQPRILLAQFNPTVGAIEHNAGLILDIINTQAPHHDVLLFPELALTGYPPEDLLLRPDFHLQVELHLKRIQQAIPNCHVIVGHPELQHGLCFNTASVFYEGRRLAHYHKQHLPNTGVFDEKRYFTPGEKRACILTIEGVRLGLCICEDLWQPGPVELLLRADIQGILAINASPFDMHKYEKRLDVLTHIAKQGVFVAYVNLVGGQDEFLFDGQSLFMDNTGTIQTHAPAFETALLSTTQQSCAPLLPPETLLYKALTLSLQDYVHKNGFKQVILGLSGGIDSALTLALAVDALGAKNVHAVKMPSRYTEPMSLEDADLELEALGVSSDLISIEPAYESLLTTLQPVFDNKKHDVTEENLQARIRGILLMALSNKKGYLVLTTTNKSELVMGYGTLYGDMAGGFAILKDVLKTQVYALARYRNSLSPVIPERVLTRAPTAELAPNQTDQDTLPAYKILDAIIQSYVEDNTSLTDLLKQGFTEADITLVITRIQRNEYKRKQAPPGPKVSSRAFGRDWRLPITNPALSY